MKVLFLQGLPGSGKTTWAKAHCHKNKDWVRVSRDDIRNMRGDYWIPKQEDMITDMERQLALIALQHGKNVIVDATNLNPTYLKSFKSWLTDSHSTVGGLLSFDLKRFDTSVEECIANDLKRPNSVGERIIRTMYRKYILPTEGALERLHPMTDRPKAVIFDIDGTLAKMCDRSPYEWGRVGEDSVDHHIKLINHLFGYAYVTLEEYKIFIVSGRDGSCYNETHEWLKKHGIQFDQLFMREAGNSEKDSIIKRRIYVNDIEPYYDVQMVFDDRDQVVEMWRGLGLKCLQVDYGDF